MANQILLVDDEIDILDMIGDFLREKGYEVDTAENGKAALEVLERRKYDLLLSDINMPQMRGFELLRIARERYPRMKSALITAYNVNDYIRLARDEDVGNIIAKTSPFNFPEVLAVVQSLITEDVFGLSRYMSPDADIRAFEIRHSNEIDAVIAKVGEFFGEAKDSLKLSIALREITTNAVFYGARSERGDEKDTWEINVALKPDQYVKVFYGRDNERLAASVVDQKGRLAKKDVLFWLDRNIERSTDGKPLNIYDVHGRGLFISRETIDRLIINIKKNVCTEMIVMNFIQAKFKGYHPLLINEFW